MHRIMKKLIYGLIAGLSVAAAILLYTPPVNASSRETLLLNGNWQMLHSENMNFPPQGEWGNCTVPSFIKGTGYEGVWFKKTAMIPESFRGMRVLIRFNGCKFNAHVYCNKNLAGSHLGGYEPFIIDITDFVKIGYENEIIVGAQTWTSLFKNKIDIAGQKPGPGLRQAPVDNIISPIGGRFEQYGIWDDVTITACADTHVTGVFVKTSVREKKLTADIEIKNDSHAKTSLNVTNTVYKEDARVLSLPDTVVTIEPDTTQTFSISKKWYHPRLWSHETPNLYHLETRLVENGKTIDIIRTRFGFREIWIKGSEFMLNGMPIKLFGTSNWPPVELKDRQQVVEIIKNIKNSNANVFRCHTQPWPEIWYDVADEMGLLIISEFAVWNDDEIYRIFDPVFWENYAAHIKGAVKRDQNHPSVIMWSIENEMHGRRMNDASPALKDLVRMGELTKKLDPTRPITYESDLDPAGSADVIGMHYPHDYPIYNQWPNTAYWMDKEINVPFTFSGKTGKWIWKHDKPLYIGEFLWCPGFIPEGDTILLGDDAYPDFPASHNPALGDIWKMQIEAYRYYGVSGMCPWTIFLSGALNDENPLYAAQKHVYEPNAVFIKEYDSRFFSEEKISRTLTVYNDVLKRSSLKLNLNLKWADNSNKSSIISSDHIRLKLDPAEKKAVKINLKMPLVTQRELLNFNFSLEDKGKILFTDTRRYSVEPKKNLVQPQGLSIALFDTSGETAAFFDSQGFTYARVNTLEATDADLMIIGRNSLDKTVLSSGSVMPDFTTFLEKGGRILVLPQKNYPEALFPTQLSCHASTITSMQVPSHPVFSSMKPDDLRFWRSDNMVTEKEPRRPVLGRGRPLVVSGDSTGISFSPLIEFPYKAGVLMLCQIKVMEKFDIEPAARVLFQNILDYLAVYKEPALKTAVVSNDKTFAAFLTKLGVNYTNITGKLSKTDLDSFGILIHKGTANEISSNLNKIREFVKRGGILLLHCPDIKEFKKISALFPSPVTLEKCKGPVLKTGNDAIASAIFNEDLYWLDITAHRAWWNPVTLTPDIIDYTVAIDSSQHQDLNSGPIPLTSPAALVKFPIGNGFILVDELKWDTETANVQKASRLASSILTSLGVDFNRSFSLCVEAEDMDDKKESKSSSSKQTFVKMNRNGKISKTINFPEKGRYVIEIIAGGTPAFHVFPRLRVDVDNVKIGSIYLNSNAWKSYFFHTTLSQGKHKIAISFVNDEYKPPEDRNLRIDKLFIYPNL